MIELIKKNISLEKTSEMRIFKAREFLQVLMLKMLYDKGYFKNMAFVGGTALRLLYDLRRFSEDLDFSLIRKEGYNFKKILNSLEAEFKAGKLPVEIKASGEKTVGSAMLKFKGILFDLGLSGIKDEKLSIKIEIDQNPPKGWNTEISLVNKDFVFSIAHFDLPSLYATKLHACFYRKYTKGRDIYDLLWYLGKKVTPNFKLFNNAVLQTEGENPQVNADNFRDFVLNKIQKIDFKKARADVERFLIDKNELNLFEANLMRHLLT